jgi:tRNA A-37 threonylcarbamoyl transferase component Bud32
LVHPRIVRTRRWLIEDDGLYVVRDIVRGKNLRQSLASPGGARPSPELIRRILLPVLEAVEYAHAQGISHGGISPENIIISEDGGIFLTDFATVDPSASHHAQVYKGQATVAGDVKALGRVLAAYLPTSGAFASVTVRGRIEGNIGRCDTLGDLGEILNTLEKIAVANSPKTAPGQTTTPVPGTQPGIPWADTTPKNAPTLKEPTQNGANIQTEPQIIVSLAERTLRLSQGGGGFATLIVRNEGVAPLIVRMIATQHAWLNVRPLDLPLTIASGQSERVGFHVSAARLSPGEYRSEIYLSANAKRPDATGEELRGGWFKHTSELRVVVDALPGAPVAGKDGKPPYPANAPVLPGAGPGCGGAVLMSLAGIAALVQVALYWAG